MDCKRWQACAGLIAWLGRVCGAIVAKEIEVVLTIWANTSKMLAKRCCAIFQRANTVSKAFLGWIMAKA